VESLGKALLVLDVQKDFIGAQARMSVAKHQVFPTLEQINNIIKRIDEEKGHIIYIGNEFKKTQFIANFFRKGAAIKGTEGAKLAEQLHVVNDVYFAKTKGNAFHNLELVNYIRSHNINEIMIVGLFAEGCVTATAKGAKKRNLSVSVIEDAIAGANDNKRDRAIKKLRSIGVSILNSHEL
jgi:nicotinamidase-related amidase